MTVQVPIGGGVETTPPAVPQPLTPGLLLRRFGQRLIIVVPVLALLLLIFYPLIAIVGQSVFPHVFAAPPNFTPDLSALQRVLSRHQTYISITSSLAQAGVTALLCCVIGTALAILINRTDLPGRRIFHLMVWLVFFAPSFVLGEAWTLILIKGGIPDQFLHFSKELNKIFFSPVGVVLVLTLKTFPLVYISVYAALRGLGSEFEDAARISGARLHTAWLRINTPLLLPAILAGGLLAFAEAISDFGTASTIGHSSSTVLITYQIYLAINTTPVDFPIAATLSLLLLLTTALALLVEARILRARSFQVISGRTRPAHPVSLARWKIPAFVFCLLVFCLALVFPLAMTTLISFLHNYGNGLAPSNFTLDYYQRLLTTGSDDLMSLGRSLWLAFAAATITTLIGLPLAYIIRRTELPGRRVLNFATLGTVAVPSIILACGYIFAWNAPYLSYIGIGGKGQMQIYGTIWVLLAAYIAGSLPFTTRLNIGALDQISQNLIETARVQGAGLGSILLRIVAPLLRTNVISTWLMVFTGTVFVLATSELLYPPGQPPVPVAIMHYNDDLRVPQGTALSVVTIIAVVLVLLIFRALPWLIECLRRGAFQPVPSVEPIATPQIGQ